MRLRRVERGSGLAARLAFAAMRLVLRRPAPDVVRLFAYRPELFGRLCGIWMQETLRGPSAWTVGERELFAAFVSSRNRCAF